MWYSGSATIRKGHLLGLSKVHRFKRPWIDRSVADNETVCGLHAPLRASRQVRPDPGDPRCQRCAR